MYTGLKLPKKNLYLVTCIQTPSRYGRVLEQRVRTVGCIEWVVVFKEAHTKVDVDLRLDIVVSLERGFSLWVIDGCKPPNQ